MSNIDLTPEQEALRDSIRRFMQAEVVPIVAQHEKARTFPFDLMPKLAELGYLGGNLPEEEGGHGIDMPTWAMMMEELGYHWLSLRTIVNITNGSIKRLAAHGTPAQKEKYLKPLMAGRLKACTGLTEPNTGSNIAGIQTRAELVGDEWVINGRKLWITNGCDADFVMVVARSFSPTCEGKLSTFIVERALANYDVRKLDTMVLRCTGTAELGFTDVRIPKENLVGVEGAALSGTLKGLDAARLNIAMGAVGAAQAALDLSTDYARQREQFGRPIGSFQLVQKHIVDMTVRVEAARALGMRAAHALQAGKDVRQACSIAKLYATEAAHEVANMALQVHGGLGYSEEYPIERIFRDTRGGMIPEGTTEIQTLIAGREILGMNAIS
ncbi:acyl-CoA dehydrogenase family protein [Achromobacter insolitus]|jgi:alkylation response protein AidB-like acyl-CoA dehydrogenase|uniref:acyl-CoA dehydrogenase family protein n=1 Tax=Achromobacter insolitus TaxID=217204 RepID=UPI000538C4CC|nr:acyl-CoA dehydrogenase family protein [Achromobacter insolitus]GLK97046.1 acyl-CoA dehydrogenase [Achromobacter xylosoxidans]APX76202.1 acyl-CoA dehydrogenase [Achromobacter insolitus]AVG41127.1 acyl-CoA dehydrogenase [Achromobacter insolitus]AXA71822.1 acyl-CoA dehydrogenase [Achromobacter insolitus]NGT13217.1 acyl-CoA dehydrogenase [Achromobacter insolitus]